MNSKSLYSELAKGLLCGCVVLANSLDVSTWAQPMSVANYRPSANISEILGKTETVPLDDAVLGEAPTTLALNFPSNVRLVKLTLRNEKRDWVDIEFRYNPRPQQRFAWDLPALDNAGYYTADWAILGYGEQLIRGSFSFAFGPDAEPPSIQREAERLLLELRYGDPTIRYVPPPRTTIILPDNAPEYDPPFTINLQENAEPQ